MSKATSKTASSANTRQLKRKLADTFDNLAAAAKAALGSPEEIQGLLSTLQRESANGKGRDRVLLRRVAHQLAELCKQGANSKHMQRFAVPMKGPPPFRAQSAQRISLTTS